MKLKPIMDSNGNITVYIPRCIDDYNPDECAKDRVKYMLELVINGQANGDQRRDKNYPLMLNHVLDILQDELQALWNKLYQDEKEHN